MVGCILASCEVVAYFPWVVLAVASFFPSVSLVLVLEVLVLEVLCAEVLVLTCLLGVFLDIHLLVLCNFLLVFVAIGIPT